MAVAGPHRPGLTARAAGLAGCRTCGKVAPADVGVCPRCGSALAPRTPLSLQRVLAWLGVGLLCYLPANLLPMLRTRTFGRETDSTIVGGVIELLHHGAWDIALVVFVASVVIPISKFVVILYLVASIRHGTSLSVEARIRLYEIVEFIGRWSMIDVFVVAILTALVQLGFLASINPGTAAVFFALSVAFTMLSAQALDPRLIWDTAEPEAPRHA
ncbi:MAG TPA: paraquat-inducible protein A [Amaricoccus sp.]|nr:paraquat-inducible protein A [Amaricoccus sp.]